MVDMLAQADAVTANVPDDRPHARAQHRHDPTHLVTRLDVALDIRPLGGLETRPLHPHRAVAITHPGPLEVAAEDTVGRTWVHLCDPTGNRGKLRVDVFKRLVRES